MAPSAKRLWLLWLLIGSVWAGKAPRDHCLALPDGKPQLYTFHVVAEFPHDPTAFTQGLVFDTRCYENQKECKEVFLESTGMYGKSDVRISHVDSGLIEARTPLDAQWFGEGLARRGDLLYQITWQKPDGFVYSVRDLSRVGSFKTPLADGWGIATDGGLFVISDGSSTLTWVDPDSGFKTVRRVEVTDGGRPVHWLNELEVVRGEVWANVWQTDCIARICPESGRVTGWVLMHGLRAALAARSLPNGGVSMDVLNGIAWDESRRRLFVTGKYWPRVFEVAIEAVNPNKQSNRQLVDSCFTH
ncbi:glutaminyl-peptide cyclotransferase [Raphidocelis subcapitata]|uniref:Glutaminyl-peptide cyclotransferase n=1 Tax=Raphidocelis subcapitata TaxID=307507 RepID=A0A2V0PA55_9CHLO|nr:glutaminyl-peptide cyclotransferase [Raphidocelis subcapitata]|eukprot:GBF94783.1 glutaminyl-peptide cyclotransferase [Raphidocelis subcapitata]